TALALGAVGTKPFLDFVHYQLPRIDSGQAFFWIEFPALIALGVAFSIVLDGGLVPTPVPVWLTLASLAIQLAAFGINFFVVLTPDRRYVEAGGIVQGRPGAEFEIKELTVNPRSLSLMKAGGGSR
nr:hypothetical protein [Acidobacteriota bacterium]